MISNPPRNALHDGLPPDELKKLVSRSGYPLQGVVARKMQEHFAVTEEWSYPDRKSQEHRSLDVFGYRVLSERENNRLTSTYLVLLVECKQSVLPYFFFKSVAYETQPISMFPTIAGIRRLELAVGPAICVASPSQCLGLASEPFFQNEPPVCVSIARAAKKSNASDQDVMGTASAGQLKVKNLEITGADAYQNVILPLAGAMSHVCELYRPGTDPTTGAFLALATCVLDAPMILVTGPPEDPKLEMVPWVRVVRKETQKLNQGFHHSTEIVDFVHRDALSSFLESLLKAADVFRDRAECVLPLFRNGRAKAPTLTGWSWDQIVTP